MLNYRLIMSFQFYIIYFLIKKLRLNFKISLTFFKNFSFYIRNIRIINIWQRTLIFILTET